MVGVLAPRVARCLLELAIAVLVFAIAIAAAAFYVASLPYRRLRGPSRQRAMLTAAQELLVAVAGLVAVARAPADRT